jgi:hypothetical protein
MMSVLRKYSAWSFQMQNVHVDPYIIIGDLQETVEKLWKTSSLGNEKMVKLSDD